MTDVIIVGAGLFGSIIGKLAEKHGYDVVYVDDQRPMAGSPPSAGLIKPTWLQGFGAPGRIGLAKLDELYGLEDLTFLTKPLGARVKVHYINPRKVLDQRGRTVVHAKVTGVCQGQVTLGNGETLHAKHILVAAGVWSPLLVPMPPVKSLAGSAFFYHGTVREPLLEIWAPYKQIKVFNCEPNLIWTGDSTGMNPTAYDATRQQQSFERCHDALAWIMGKPMRREYRRTLSGLRPVVESHKQGYFAQTSPGVYVATGGGKMGSVLAGYHAQQFLEAIR